jgi:hypothetical protein
VNSRKFVAARNAQELPKMRHLAHASLLEGGLHFMTAMDQGLTLPSFVSPAKKKEG